MANITILNSAIIPFAKEKNGFALLSRDIFFNVFSFLQRSDLANFTRSYSLIPTLQKQYNALVIDKRVIAWKKILNSLPQVVSFLNTPCSYGVVKNNFFWASGGKRYFMDLTNLSMDVHRFDGNIQSEWFNEKVSVEYNGTFFRGNVFLKIFDNEKKSLICKVNLTKCDIVHVFGTQKIGQTLEFVTVKGDILVLDAKKVYGSDKKELTEEQLDLISCIPPKEFQEVIKSKEKNCRVLQAYKVKETYYFRWVIEGIRKCPIFFMNKINFFAQVLEPESSYLCNTDDNFFYVPVGNIIKIYKGETLWKKIVVNEKLINFGIFPSNYGLVVKVNRENCSEIFIWDHTKCAPNSETTLLFKTMISSNRPMFVRDDLLVYEKNKKWEVCHLGKKEVIGILPMTIDKIFMLITSNNPLPDRIIVHCENVNDLPSNRGFQIFSRDRCV